MKKIFVLFILILSIFFMNCHKKQQVNNDIEIFSNLEYQNDKDTDLKITINSSEDNQIIGYYLLNSSQINLFFEKLTLLKGNKTFSKPKFSGDFLELSINNIVILLNNKHIVFGTDYYEVDINIDDLINEYEFISKFDILSFNLILEPNITKITIIKESESKTKLFLTSQLKINGFLEKLNNYQFLLKDKELGKKIYTVIIDEKKIIFYDNLCFTYQNKTYSLFDEINLLNQYNQGNVDKYETDSGFLPWV